jgi:hypothetical protein
MQYAPSCGLTVQAATATATNQVALVVTQDQNQAVASLQGQNFQFLNYSSSNWQQASPSTSPTVFSNGTYLIQPPTGVDPGSYLVQVEDPRGIIVVASSYSSYNVNLTWPSPTVAMSTYNYINNNTCDVDSNGNIGTWSNFTAQEYGPDKINDTLTEADVPIVTGSNTTYVQTNNQLHDTNIGSASNFTTEQYTDNIYDTLTEANVPRAVPETYVYGNNNQNPGGWTSPTNAYDNNIATSASFDYKWVGWSGYLVINLTGTTVGTKIQYMIGRETNTSNLWTTMTVNVANQTGSWVNVYNGTPIYASTTYQNLTFSSTNTYTAMEFQFYFTGSSSCKRHLLVPKLSA